MQVCEEFDASRSLPAVRRQRPKTNKGVSCSASTDNESRKMHPTHQTNLSGRRRVPMQTKMHELCNHSCRAAGVSKTKSKLYKRAEAPTRKFMRPLRPAWKDLKHVPFVFGLFSNFRHIAKNTRSRKYMCCVPSCRVVWRSPRATRIRLRPTKERHGLVKDSPNNPKNKRSRRLAVCTSAHSVAEKIDNSAEAR